LLYHLLNVFKHLADFLTFSGSLNSGESFFSDEALGLVVALYILLFIFDRVLKLRLAFREGGRLGYEERRSVE
jgi:cytochrome c biogenesis factor